MKKKTPYIMDDGQLVDWVLFTLKLLGDDQKVPVATRYLRRLAVLAKNSPKFDK